MASDRNKALVEYWAAELKGSEKRWRSFCEQAKRVSAIYEAETPRQNSFNILYSNTETLLPSLYNATPRPYVSRRYKDDNKAALVAGKLLQRALEYHVDTPDPAYTSFDTLMESATLGALVPGLGVTRLKYDVEFTQLISDPAAEKEKAMGKGVDDDTGDLVQDNLVGVEVSEAEPTADVKYEAVCGEVVAYDRVRFGPGRTWQQVPWVAFLHKMTRLDAKKSFGAGPAGKLKYRDTSGKEARDDEDASKAADERSTVDVWEIWHRTTKRVYFIVTEHLDGPLRDVADPFGLQGFFPCPEPVILFSRVKDYIPRPLYLFYEEQAKELNRVSTRINKLIEMCKIRGFYGAGLSGLQDLLDAPEGTMRPAQSQGMAQEGATPANSIWLMPIKDVIAVLQQLYIQRQQIKQVIYEVTGISDILRGSTVASETATAQSLKNQWGTLRLKKMQKRVQNYVRDYLRLVAELMCNKYSPQTWSTVTGVQLPTMLEKQKAQQVLMEMQQAQSAPPVPGAPPPQPPDPEMVKNASLPSWEEIAALLQNDLLRNYAIDIETNSTVEPDAVEDQEQIAKLMGAISNMFQSMGPVVQQGALPMGAFKGMLLGVSRRFRFGDEVEEALDQIPDQLPPAGGDDGKAEEQKLKLQVTEAETKNKMALMDKELEIKQAELDLQKEELALKREELAQKKQLNAIKFEGQMQAARAKQVQAQVQAQTAAMMPPAGPAIVQPGAPNAPV